MPMPPQQSGQFYANNRPPINRPPESFPLMSQANTNALPYPAQSTMPQPQPQLLPSSPGVISNFC